MHRLIHFYLTLLASLVLLACSDNHDLGPDEGRLSNFMPGGSKTAVFQVETSGSRWLVSYGMRQYEFSAVPTKDANPSFSIAISETIEITGSFPVVQNDEEMIMVNDVIAVIIYTDHACKRFALDLRNYLVTNGFVLTANPIKVCKIRGEAEYDPRMNSNEAELAPRP